MHDNSRGSRSVGETLARAAAVTVAWCAIVGAACSIVVAAQAPPDTSPRADRPAVERRTVREGMAIDFDVRHYDPAGPHDRELREGDTVDIGFTVRDVGSANPISSLNPAAWLALARTRRDGPRASCTDLVRTALGQSLLSRPELDLNAYYVVALNDDATITVVDPLFGFGGTKLLAMVALQSPGEDWVLTADQDRLFVSMPGVNRVAVVDTRAWSVATNIDVGPRPSRVALQPDEGYLWVAHAADAKSARASGVTVLDARTLKVVARIPLGSGPHEIAFSDDSRFAFVTNGDAGTVSIVDVRTLRKVKDVGIGSPVSSIAFSTLARAAYVTSQEAGTVTGIGVASLDVVARIGAAPGVGAIEFAPDGRLGFAVNTRANTVSIFDAALNRVVRTADLEKGPDQLAFSKRFAYVRHRDSEIVVMMPLDELGTEGRNVPLLDFPGGQHPLGGGARSSLAASIVRSADDNAVLVANPRDKAIYYYKEGMAAPMGQFSNYGKEPVAVLVVDRSLRETRPGEYRSVVRLPAAGQYDALLFIDSPRVVHCFDVSIAPPVRQAPGTEGPSTRIEPLTRETSVTPGTAIRIALRLTDAATGTPVPNVRDAGVLVVAPGVWQTRQALEHEGDGVYALIVVPPSAGLYDVFVASPSRQMPYRRVFTFEAGAGLR